MDRVQARLAWVIRLTDRQYTRDGSTLWREKLEGTTRAERLASARSLLLAASKDSRNHDDHKKLTAFMSCVEAMHMVVDLKSQLRNSGDDVAHNDLTRPQFVSVVDEYCKTSNGGAHEKGLREFIQFLF